MTQVKERERVRDRPVREPPVRTAPPPKVPHPPRVAMPVRWIGWAAALIILAGAGVVAWLVFGGSAGEETYVADLFTQQREAGVEYTGPEVAYAGDLFTQQREAGLPSTVRPDEAMSGLITQAGIPAVRSSAGLRWVGVSGPTLEEHLLTLQPDEAGSGLTGPALRGEDTGTAAGDVGFRWAGVSGPTLEELEAGD